MTFGRTALALAAGVATFSSTAAIAGENTHTGVSKPAMLCEKYTVQPGDSLAKIAMRATGSHDNAEMIFRMNGHQITDMNMIEPGMELEMPCGEDWGLVVKEGGATFDTKHMPIAETEWQAMPGDYLVDVISKWGNEAGYDVIVEQNSDWRFAVEFSSNSDFRAALDEALAGFATAAYPPVIVFYTNNVMTIGVR